MPPKAPKAKKSAAKPAAAEHAEEHEPTNTELKRVISTAFGAAHASISSHATQRKVLMSYARNDIDQFSHFVTDLVLRCLRLNFNAETSRRHMLFLGELCKSIASDEGPLNKNDTLPWMITTNAFKFHNAQDKGVRASVCTILNDMLRKLDREVDRTDAYEEIIGGLLYRVHDKCPAVREKAVLAVSVFSANSDDDEVTQHLLSVMCEDGNANVRKQAIAACHNRSVYYTSLIRMTRDSVSTVRQAAWEKLAKFKFTHMVEYSKSYRSNLCQLLAQGFSDSSKAVREAAKSTTFYWYKREGNCDLEKMFGHLNIHDTNFASVEQVAKDMLQIHINEMRKVHGADCSPERYYFALDLRAMSPANTWLWRVSCLHAIEQERNEEDNLLIPLKTFSSVVQEIKADYSNPGWERTQESCTIPANPDNELDAEVTLRVLLAMFAIYQKSGYLDHADDATRLQTVKVLGMIFRIVQTDNPGQFVDSAMSALKELTARHPHERRDVIQQVIQRMFTRLTLTMQNDISIDDPDTFGQRDEERRQQLLRYQSRRQTGDDVSQLADEIENDSKSLQRMMHVTRAFLAYCSRTDRIPSFVSMMINLGKSQKNPGARAIALKAQCLQCMVDVDMVHTFLPTFVKTAREPVRQDEIMVTEAAVGSLFDLVGEYGLGFFDTPTEGPAAPAMVTAEEEDAARDNVANMEEEDRRKHHEDHQRAEDTAKVGADTLLRTVLIPFLDHSSTRVQHLATFSFSRLLTINRIPRAAAPFILSKIILNNHNSSADLKKAVSSRDFEDLWAKDICTQMGKCHTFFLSSYALHSPNYMQQMTEGGIRAIRAFLSNADDGMAGEAAKLVKRVVDLSDAAYLQEIREQDPHQKTLNMTRNDDEEDDDDRSNVALNRSLRTNNTSISSVSQSRLLRNLYRFSQHEWVACELLLEASYLRTRPALLRAIVGELERLRLWKRDTATHDLIIEHATHCLSKIKDTPSRKKINDFKEGVKKLVNESTTNFSNLYDDESDTRFVLAKRTAVPLAERQQIRLQDLDEAGIVLPEDDDVEDDDGSSAPASRRTSGRLSGRTSGRTSTRSSGRSIKEEPAVKRERKEYEE